jgi:hypothetical protein
MCVLDKLQHVAEENLLNILFTRTSLFNAILMYATLGVPGKPLSFVLSYICVAAHCQYIKHI